MCHLFFIVWMIVVNLNVMLMHWNFTMSSQTEWISSLLATEVRQTCYSWLCQMYFSFHFFFLHQWIVFPSLFLLCTCVDNTWKWKIYFVALCQSVYCFTACSDYFPHWSYRLYMLLRITRVIKSTFFYTIALHHRTPSGC